jgi:hypothetical protein
LIVRVIFQLLDLFADVLLRDRMVVDDTKVPSESICLLKMNPVLDGTQIVAKVDETSRLDAGKDNLSSQHLNQLMA